MSDVARMNQLLAAELIGALAGGGLRHLVASPGARSAPLLMAAASCPAIELHVVLDERVAGFVALGLAKATGRAVALLCTSGSAAAHYYPAVLEAEAAGVPLLVLSSNRPPELQGCGAPQTLDQTRLFGAHARWFRSLGPADPALTPALLQGVAAQALDAAERPVGGVAQLDVAFRKPLYSPDLPPLPATPVRPPRAVPVDGGAIRWDAGSLRGATRGLIVCGPQAGLSDARAFGRELAQLAEHLGWPVLAEPLGHAHGSGSEALVGPGELLVRDEAFAASQRPDVVLRFGGWPTSKALGSWLAALDAPQVLVEPGGRLLDPAYRADAILPLAPAAACDALRAELPPGPRPRGWLRSWQEASARLETQLAPLCDEEPLWEGAVARAVAESLPPNALLHVAASMPVRDLDTFAPRLPAGAVVASNRGLNGIDGTLSTAWGEALAWDAPLTVLCGDLALLHDAGGLLAAAGLGVSATVVVVQNGGGGIFERLPLGQHPEHEALFVTPQRAQLASLCAAAGATHARVETLSELRAALRGPRREGLRVVEAMCPRPLNLRQHAVAAELAANLSLEASCPPR